jgi:hypothetical protein
MPGDTQRKRLNFTYNLRISLQGKRWGFITWMEKIINNQYFLLSRLTKFASMKMWELVRQTGQARRSVVLFQLTRLSSSSHTWKKILAEGNFTRYPKKWGGVEPFFPLQEGLSLQDFKPTSPPPHHHAVVFLGEEAAHGLQCQPEEGDDRGTRFLKLEEKRKVTL